MKNLITFHLIFSLLLFGGLACRYNPLAKFNSLYKCTMAGEPDPQTSQEFSQRALLHIEKNNYSDKFDECAFGAASEALRLDPKNAHALAIRGSLYSAKQDYVSAFSDLNEAIRLSPDDSFFYSERSSVFEKQNMFDKAIEDYSIAMKRYNSHYNFAKRGSLYFKNDEFENALKDYTEAIRLKPDFENYYTMRAEVYRKLGKTSEAETDELKAKEFEDKAIATTGFSYKN